MMGGKPNNSVSLILLSLLIFWYGGERGGKLSYLDLIFRTSKQLNNMDRFQELLKTNYNIPVEDYFTLTEEEREGLIDIVIEYYINNLIVNPDFIYLYLKIISDQISKAVEQDQFERADIMTRTKNRLSNLLYEDN
jgi:hypothetical protein